MVAGDDQPAQMCEQAALDIGQRCLRGFAQSGFQREGMVDQADRTTCRYRVIQTAERRQGEAVDHRFAVGRQTIPRGAGGIAGEVIDDGKVADQFDDVDGVTKQTQAGDDAAVIAIAARRPCQTAMEP